MEANPCLTAPALSPAAAARVRAPVRRTQSMKYMRSANINKFFTVQIMKYLPSFNS